LYEGASVRTNHPDAPTDHRKVDEVLGWLRNVRVDEKGELRADLHYLKTHPMAPALVEAAQRNPGLFGLSHNVEAETSEEKDGTLLI
ncbi:hypothetical protein ABTH87_19140, partial [Acinetobacter baumannii]